MGKPEEKRPRRGWEDKIKIDLQEEVSGEWTGSSWLGIGTAGRFL